MNNYKSCSTDALKETLRLTINWRNHIMDRSTKLKERCDRYKDRYKVEPSVELNNKICDLEGRYKKDWWEAGELTTEIIAMKYEILDRQIEEKYADR